MIQLGDMLHLVRIFKSPPPEIPAMNLEMRARRIEARRSRKQKPLS